MNKNNDFLTATEVAEQLRVSARTIHNRIKSGDLKGGKIGRKYLIKSCDLNNYIHNLIHKK